MEVEGVMLHGMKGTTKSAEFITKLGKKAVGG